VRLFADEGVESRIVERLRFEGHDVEYVAELAPGIDDDGVLDRANSEDRVLVTVDKDFGELVFRLRRTTSGVLLFRLSGLSSDDKAAVVAAVVRDHGHEILGTFTVISPGVVRIRPQR
jgi:predicted nuclease of predicted toxin-antitoxin system